MNKNLNTLQLGDVVLSIIDGPTFTNPMTVTEVKTATLGKKSFAYCILLSGNAEGHGAFWPTGTGDKRTVSVA